MTVRIFHPIIPKYPIPKKGLVSKYEWQFKDPHSPNRNVLYFVLCLYIPARYPSFFLGLFRYLIHRNTYYFNPKLQLQQPWHLTKRISTCCSVYTS